MWGFLPPNWIELLPRFVKLSSISICAPHGGSWFSHHQSDIVLSMSACSVASRIPSDVEEFHLAERVNLVPSDFHFIFFPSDFHLISSDFHLILFHLILISFEFFWFHLSPFYIPNDNPIVDNANMVNNINCKKTLYTRAPTNIKLSTLVAYLEPHGQNYKVTSITKLWTLLHLILVNLCFKLFYNCCRCDMFALWLVWSVSNKAFERIQYPPLCTNGWHANLNQFWKC